MKNAATQNFAKEKKLQNLSNSGSGFNSNNSQTLGSTYNKSFQL